MDSLPREILGQIMQLVGAANFREDPNRMVVAKFFLWYARMIVFGEVTLNAMRLEDFPNISVEFMGALRAYTRRISIELRGFTHWNLLHYPEGSINHLNFATLKDWTDELNAGLWALAMLITHFTALKELVITAKPEFNPAVPYAHTRSYLYDSAISSLLCQTVGRLTLLNLDICGTDILPPGTHETPLHLCKMIHEHLPFLKTLRLSLRYLCPSVVEVMNTGGPWPMERLIIHLIFQERDGQTVSSASTRPCEPGQDWLDRDLHKDLADALLMVSPLMPDLKQMSIISHCFPSLCTIIYDPITRRSGMVPEGMEHFEDEDATSARYEGLVRPWYAIGTEAFPFWRPPLEYLQQPG